jgi:hypothetical protein
LTPLFAWQRGEEVAGMIVGLVFLLLYLALIVFGMVLGISNLIINFLALDKLPPQFRQMEPWQVFLLLIPCFNVVWMFFVLTKVPASLQAYFYANGRKDVDDCGAQLGLWTAITLIVCPIVPLVTLPMYLFKINGLRKQIGF